MVLWFCNEDNISTNKTKDTPSPLNIHTVKKSITSPCFKGCNTLQVQHALGTVVILDDQIVHLFSAPRHQSIEN